MMLQNDLAQSQLLAKTTTLLRMRPHLFTFNSSQIINNIKVDFLMSDTVILATVNKFNVIGYINFPNIPMQPTRTDIIEECVSADWENNEVFINSLYAVLRSRFSLLVSTNIQSDNQQKIWKMLSANSGYVVKILDNDIFRTRVDTITLDQATIDHNIANNIPATAETGIKLVTNDVTYNGSNLDDSELWSIFPNVTLVNTRLALSAV